MMPEGTRQADEANEKAVQNRSRKHDFSHREEILDVEVQADAEHQENHANFSQLAGDFLVGNKAGCVRPDSQTGEQIADDGG